MRGRRLDQTLIRQWLPKRRPGVHKGDCGRVVIVGGSRGMVGAPTLTSWGAMRSGAGLVKLITVKGQQAVAAKRAPLEATTLGVPEDAHGTISSSGLAPIFKTIKDFHADIVAVGPGCGRSKGVTQLIKKLLWSSPVPVVLDADGLNALSAFKPRRIQKPVILTPHEGECARLIGWPIARVKANREAAAQEVAKRWGGICLLKGYRTLITDGKRMFQNTTGNPGMATAGMGDVLTGVIAALWGQGKARDREDGFKAACAGAFLHGRAADLAIKKFPIGSLLATDLIQFIPQAILKIRRFTKYD